MARVYWRLSPAFWVDDKVVGSEDYPGWSDNAKMLAVYLLTCEHRTLPGLYRLPKAYIQEDLRWDRERLDAAFRELIRDQFLEYDGRRHIVLIMNALDYQKPEGPKQCVGTARILETLPDSPLLHRFYGIAQEKCPPLADLLPDRFRYPIDTQSIPNQNPSDTQSIQEAKEEEEAKEEDIPYGVAKIATEHVDDFAELLEQLRTARSIVRYTVEGHDGGVIWIPTFKRHQNPHKNEKPSELPAYSDIAKLREDSGASTEVLAPRARLSSSLNPSSLNPSSLNPDIPVGVAETATDADEFADIDFGGPDSDTEQPPQNGKRPTEDTPEQPPEDNAGTMVGYLVDYAGEIEFTLTGSKKGHFARAIGDIWKAGVDPEILRRAIRQALEENKSPAHLVDVVNDLKGGARGKTRRDSGRSQHGEWE